MRLGQAAMEALRAEITGCLKPGDELVVACPVALKGTSVIAKNKKDKTGREILCGFIQNCVSLWDAYGAGSIVWKIAQEADASALYAMGEGGFLSALWKMAEASEVGLEADFRKVPIRQETIEVCEIFDLNPYKLQADGAVLIGIRGGEALVQRLRNEGFMAEVIGQTNSGNDRLLYSGGSARYLDVRQRMNCSNFSKSNCRKLKRQFSKKRQTINNKRNKNKMAKLNIVLHEPEIPANTGNIGRTCVATGTRLHLIEPLGFSLSEKALKRAGMDYWKDLDVTTYLDFEDFLEKNPGAKIYYATTKAPQTYTDVHYEEDCYIMFGKESAGIPEDILVNNQETCVRIPMIGDIRSLNLSNSVAIVLYEALRQNNFDHMNLEGHLRNYDWK